MGMLWRGVTSLFFASQNYRDSSMCYSKPRTNNNCKEKHLRVSSFCFSYNWTLAPDLECWRHPILRTAQNVRWQKCHNFGSYHFWNVAFCHASFWGVDPIFKFDPLSLSLSPYFMFDPHPKLMVETL